MVRIFSLLCFISFFSIAFGENPKVILKTSMGDITILLYKDKVPKTVENFLKLSRKDFYDGVIFHRVIKGFMSQTGDPTGTGSGGPGYTFEDEFHPSLKHDKEGILSMANRGPHTNGSQFFIIAAPQPHLDGRHAVFGEVIEGFDVAKKINNVATGMRDRPIQEVKVLDVVISGEKQITIDKKLLKEKATALFTPIIQNACQSLGMPKEYTIEENRLQTKENRFLLIWDIIFSKTESSVFWVKGLWKDEQIEVKEFHFSN